MDFFRPISFVFRFLDRFLVGQQEALLVKLMQSEGLMEGGGEVRPMEPLVEVVIGVWSVLAQPVRQ